MKANNDIYLHEKQRNYFLMQNLRHEMKRKENTNAITIENNSLKKEIK